MTAPSVCLWLSDFGYLAFRVLAVLGTMLALFVAGPKNPDQHSPVTIPGTVSQQIFTQQTLNSSQHAALVAKVRPRLRMLQAVMERLPKTFTPYAHVPKYRLTYYVETLACGHQKFFFPQTRFDQHSHCSGCDAVIEWWITPAGKKMPMDVTDSGQAQAHWASCPKADCFRNVRVRPA